LSRPDAVVGEERRSGLVELEAGVFDDLREEESWASDQWQATSVRGKGTNERRDGGAVSKDARRNCRRKTSGEPFLLLRRRTQEEHAPVLLSLRFFPSRRNWLNRSTNSHSFPSGAIVPSGRRCGIQSGWSAISGTVDGFFAFSPVAVGRVEELVRRVRRIPASTIR
jgi:hypothetical protein